MNIIFETIPDGLRDPGQYFEISTKAALHGLPGNDRNVLLVGQRLKAYVEPARFQGGTLNDATSSGDFTGLAKKDFIVQVSLSGATDKFKYSTDGGTNWSAEIDITGAAQALEDGAQVTFTATTGHAVGDEWRFSGWPEPSEAEAKASIILSADGVANGFGYGSVAHRMALAALKANRRASLSCITLDDAATAQKATGSVTLTGSAVTSGEFVLHAAPESIKIGFAAGDTLADIAISLQNEMARNPERSLVTAVDGATPAKLNLTAKNGGTLGNGIHLDYDVTPGSGIGATIVAMSGGTTDPDIDTALTPIQAEEFNIIVPAWTDEDSLGKLRTHLGDVTDFEDQHSSVAPFVSIGNYADAATRSGWLNNGRMPNLWCRYGTASKRRSVASEASAILGVMMSAKTDPAVPYNTMALPGVIAPALEDRISGLERKACFNSGVAPSYVGADGVVRIKRLITTYTQTQEGVDDDSLLDLTTTECLDYGRKALRTCIALKFPNSKLHAKTPARVRTEVVDTALKLESAEIWENVSDNLDAIEVERNANARDRVDMKIPADVVDGLHVVAAQIYQTA